MKKLQIAKNIYNFKTNHNAHINEKDDFKNIL
jgi:hypothetical protein